MSTCNIDKWNMLAPTFDAFEIPKIGEDDCLTLINDLKLLTKDSSVMDVAAVPVDTQLHLHKCAVV